MGMRPANSENIIGHQELRDNVYILVQYAEYADLIKYKQLT